MLQEQTELRAKRFYVSSPFRSDLDPRPQEKIVEIDTYDSGSGGIFSVLFLERGSIIAVALAVARKIHEGENLPIKYGDRITDEDKDIFKFALISQLNVLRGETQEQEESDNFWYRRKTLNS